jgi:transcriptional regulator with XRE-family HTH domain
LAMPPRKWLSIEWLAGGANAEMEPERCLQRLQKAGLTQQQLAELVGTKGSVISRLEDDDYAGHSLRMLQRISAALNCRVEIRFLPARAHTRVAS